MQRCRPAQSLQRDVWTLTIPPRKHSRRTRFCRGVTSTCPDPHGRAGSYMNDLSNCIRRALVAAAPGAFDARDDFTARELHVGRPGKTPSDCVSFSPGAGTSSNQHKCEGNGQEATPGIGNERRSSPTVVGRRLSLDSELPQTCRAARAVFEPVPLQQGISAVIGRYSTRVSGIGGSPRRHASALV